MEQYAAEKQYTLEDFQKLHQKLRENEDEKYRKFNEGLIPGSENKSYGVRVPVLRTIAKEILQGDWQGFIKYAQKDPGFEIKMLHGMVVALAQIPFDKKMEWFKEFIPRVDNWAVCDIVCGDFKDIRKHREEGYRFLEACLHSQEEFTVRVGVVLLLQHFLVEEYIQRVLKDLVQVRQEGYYVKMAVAWALSFCYIKFPKETHPVLEQGSLDTFTHNKAIQKMLESYRISKEEKEILRVLKK